MRDHLKFNTLVNSENWVEVTKKCGKGLTGDRPKKGTDIKKKSLIHNLDDLFDLSLKGHNGFDESLITDMDSSDVLNHLNFIKDGLDHPDGSQMMSVAHQLITPEQVMQLLS